MMSWNQAFWWHVYSVRQNVGGTHSIIHDLRKLPERSNWSDAGIGNIQGCGLVFLVRLCKVRNSRLGLCIKRDGVTNTDSAVLDRHNNAAVREEYSNRSHSHVVKPAGRGGVTANAFPFQMEIKNDQDKEPETSVTNNVRRTMIFFLMQMSTTSEGGALIVFKKNHFLFSLCILYRNIRRVFYMTIRWFVTTIPWEYFHIQLQFIYIHTYIFTYIHACINNQYTHI